jgi:ferrous iron transport protein B
MSAPVAVSPVRSSRHLAVVRERPLRVALAGNPNSGKTSIFNALTGARQHVANYPGVTVERHAGECRIAGRRVEIVDLPGTYSLGAYSPEEQVAEAELALGPDVVVMVADSTQLSRHLVLLAQLMQGDANLVLCLNMSDEARASGQVLDLPLMERLLGVPVVATVGNRGQGLAELGAAIDRAARAPARGKLVLGAELDEAIARIGEHLPSDRRAFCAARLLAGDEAHAARAPAEAVAEAARQRRRLEAASGRDIHTFITERYFGFVDGLLREVRTAPPAGNARQLSDRIDAVVVHRALGLPIFAAVMYAIFWATFSVGEAPMGWIEAGVAWVGGAVSGLWPAGSESPLRSLLVDGVIAGVGGVIVFLPNILLLFLGLAILEDTGYLARAAFLTDRLMHGFGLHGKSFIPMVSGFGCSVPGIMATRTIENHRDRLVTMLVLPLMSCGARLPIWMLLIPAFFPPVWRAPALALIYVAGVLLALTLALVLRKTVLAGEDAPFVMELPPYRMPTLRSVVLKVSSRAGLYLRKAGTIILAISVVMWVATTFPKAESYRVDAEVAAGAVQLSDTQIAAHRASEDLESSIAGRVGRSLAPVFAPLGFDWKIVTAMIGAFAAKEVFVAQMGIVYSVGEVADGEGLRARLARDYTPLAGISMMLFLLIATPCLATVAVTRRESGRWRWALLQLGGLTAVAYLVSLAVYQLGRLVS